MTTIVNSDSVVDCRPWSVLRNVTQRVPVLLLISSGERERTAGLAAPEISGGTSGPETQLFPVSPPGKTDWDVIR